MAEIMAQVPQQVHEFYPVIKHLNAQQLTPLHPSLLKYNFRSWIQKMPPAGHDSGSYSRRFSEVISSDWKSIFAIDPICGVNLEEKRFEFKVGDFMLHYTFHSKTQEGRKQDHAVYYSYATLRKRVCFVGASLDVFVNMQGKEKKAVFVVSFCKCASCMQPWCLNVVLGEPNPRMFEFDITSLKPVDMCLRFKYNKDKHDVKLTFQPGVVDRFDMMKDDDNSNYFAVAYYCSVPLDSLPIFPFQDFVKRVTSHRFSRVTGRTDMDKKNISIEISGIAPIPAVMLNVIQQNKFEQQSSAFSALYENKEYTDLVVFSKDGKAFHCNKIVLRVRSTVFERMLAGRNFKEGQDGTIKLEEGALATETLIKFIYFQDTGIERLSFIGMVGTLKLAHLYGFMELMAISAKALLVKIKELEWEDVETLWDLYSFVNKVDMIQIIARLKIASIMALRRLILAKKNKRVRRDDQDVTESVNRAFGNYADLGKDLTLDLFRLLGGTT
ncbi:unnamed protein product [Orchesella dallaii]|uniref:BTB domain-containing protein n=1 Tax=Orchesella dallaii TaxID=48710 RepID=A0ABP1Q262_9HEXA